MISINRLILIIIKKWIMAFFSKTSIMGAPLLVFIGCYALGLSILLFKDKFLYSEGVIPCIFLNALAK